MNLKSLRADEKYLQGKGWEIIDYPYPRGSYLYETTVYSRPSERGVWTLEGALEQQRIAESIDKSKSL